MVHLLEFAQLYINDTLIEGLKKGDLKNNPTNNILKLDKAILFAIMKEHTGARLN